MATIRYIKEQPSITIAERRYQKRLQDDLSEVKKIVPSSPTSAKANKLKSLLLLRERDGPMSVVLDNPQGIPSRWSSDTGGTVSSTRASGQVIADLSDESEEVITNASCDEGGLPNWQHEEDTPSRESAAQQNSMSEKDGKSKEDAEILSASRIQFTMAMPRRASLTGSKSSSVTKGRTRSGTVPMPLDARGHRRAIEAKGSPASHRITVAGTPPRQEASYFPPVDELKAMNIQPSTPSSARELIGTAALQLRRKQKMLKSPSDEDSLGQSQYSTPMQEQRLQPGRQPVYSLSPSPESSMSVPTPNSGGSTPSMPSRPCHPNEALHLNLKNTKVHKLLGSPGSCTGTGDAKAHRILGSPASSLGGSVSSLSSRGTPLLYGSLSMSSQQGTAPTLETSSCSSINTSPITKSPVTRSPLSLSRPPQLQVSQTVPNLPVQHRVQPRKQSLPMRVAPGLKSARTTFSMKRRPSQSTHMSRQQSRSEEAFSGLQYLQRQ